MRILFLALFMVTACGQQESKNQDNQKPTQTLTTNETAKAPAGQPRYLMVKVPVDSEGNELIGSAESKVIADGANLASSEAAIAAFETASSVNVADELDQTSSTQSWGRGFWYWNTPWYPGKVIGRGLWWGRNPYLHYNNFSYGYNYGNSYSYGGCNYYYWANY